METASPLCRKCNKEPKIPNKYICKPCAAEYAKKRYRQKMATDPNYRKYRSEQSKRLYHASLEKRRASSRESNRRRRQRIIDHYGGVCACCGETAREFMALDHINGGGNKHIREVHNISAWIVRNNFPEGFRVLCHNCNMAKGIFGYCPHGNC